MKFKRALEVGKVGEGLIAAWLQARGNAIMPAYEIEKSVGKGPQLFCLEAERVAPDMLCFTTDGVRWIEAKHKTRFTWHRKTAKWTTGIDLRHYRDYQAVQLRTNLPVWLLFYHASNQPSADDLAHSCPAECPTGLLGNDLRYLVDHESHDSLPFDATREGFLGHGKTGMVYWAHESLRLLATTDAVEQAARELKTRRAA